MEINLLAFLMQEYGKHNEQFKRIFGTLMLMAEAEDGNIAFSHDDIGVNVTEDTIDIVDINAGKSIAVLKLELK